MQTKLAEIKISTIYDVVAEFRQRGRCGIFCDASRCVMGRVYELSLMGRVLAKVPRRRHHLEWWLEIHQRVMIDLLLRHE